MTSVPQTELKNEILLRIQKNFPLEEKPFLAIATHKSGTPLKTPSAFNLEATITLRCPPFGMAKIKPFGYRNR